MRILFILLLTLLAGCSAAPLEISERLSPGHSQPTTIEGTLPVNISLHWAPQPIEDFIISQNADGYTGRSDYQDFAVGRLISKRVEDYLGSVTRIIQESDNRVTITIESVRLNYKYRWESLAYAKLLINAEITVDGETRHKIYYRQIENQPDMATLDMLGSIFDRVAIEMGQDILTTLAR